MYCPSCENFMDEGLKYCGRCGMFLNAKSEKLVHLGNNLAWMWRRSWAGFAAAFIGWIVALGVSRMIGQNLNPVLNSLFSGMICGVYLGTAGGIFEESAYKAFLGGILGTIGGAIGGFVNIPLIHLLSGANYSFPVSFLASWAIGGAFIGAASGIVEKSAKKTFFGSLFGFIGGGAGGFLGSLFYASVAADFNVQGWMAKRLVEGVSGGIVGAFLWFFIGIIEKLYIFARKEAGNIDFKLCEKCKTNNNLRFWYCANCGYPLQTAAPRRKIYITPFRGIERVANSLKFLSWLFGVTGVTTTPVIFLIFLFQDLFLALLSVAITVLFSYMMVVFFRFLADFAELSAKLLPDKKTGG